MHHRAVLASFRRTFLELFDKVLLLQEQPFQAANVCLQIQLKLIKRTKYVEGRIRKYKKQIRCETDTCRKQFYEDGLDQYRNVLCLLRKVGDCIAFIYLSPFDIKPHAFGHSHGFISGKSGLKLETKLLRAVCEANHPSLLTDLTNSLKHGDLFVFAETRSPVIVEIKSGKLDGRGRRQMRRLKALSQYLKTDETDTFFGKDKKVFRFAPNSPVKYHDKELRSVVAKAYCSGTCIQDIEDGLVYVAMTDDHSNAIASTVERMHKPYVFFLNLNKYNSEPIPFTPLLLLLKNSSICWDFYCGHLLLFVIVDLAKVASRFRKRGCTFNWDEDDNDYFSVSHPNLDYMKVSKAFFARVGFEFLGLSWIVDLSSTTSKIDSDLVECV